MVERIPIGRMGEPGRGRRARLLARERGVLVLDRRHVRHLRRPGGLLMRRMIRWSTPTGASPSASSAKRTARSTSSSERTTRCACSGRVVDVRLDPIELEPTREPRARRGLTLLPPLDPPEVWCAGVTYERSRDARMEESAGRDVYALVYDAARPELFLKDAGVPPHGRPGRADRRSAATRAGTSPSRRSASSSGEGGRSSATRSATTSPRARSRARTRSTCLRRRSTPARARSARRSYDPADEPQGFEIVLRITRRATARCSTRTRRRRRR